MARAPSDRPAASSGQRPGAFDPGQILPIGGAWKDHLSDDERTMGEFLLVALVGLLLAAIVVGIAAAVRTPRPVPGPAPGPSPWTDRAEGSARVTLDLTVEDATSPSVQRLVHEAASRALDASPALRVVEVVDLTGRRLGEIRKVPPLRKDVELPASLHEPRAPRSRAPDPLRSDRDAGTGTPRAVALGEGRRSDEPIEAPGARPFADRFDLPGAVRDRISDPHDPVEVVEALLAAAGRPVERRGDLVLSGDVAVVVTLVEDDAERALSRAYLKVRSSGAAYGLVIRLGYADPVLVHQREVAAPAVRHVPASAVQRMADAVALGSDPLTFALGPPVAH